MRRKYTVIFLYWHTKIGYRRLYLVLRCDWFFKC